MVRWVGLVALLGSIVLAGCGEEERERSPTAQAGGDGGGAGGAGGEGGEGGGGSGGEGGAGGGVGGEGGAGGFPAPEVRQLTPRLAGIVDARAADDVREKLFQTDGVDLIHPLNRFYETFPNVFDFVFFLTEAEGSSAVGVHVPINRPAIPGTGIDWAYSDRRSPSATLRSAIALRLGSNGPTLHEVAHHWAVNLSSEFGFSGGHWGYAGVAGQLGGFDPESLFCQTPEGARPPCEPDDDGSTTYLVDNFGLVANGGDSVPYAPLELYLMGLVPPEEVPPIPVFVDVLENTRLPGSIRAIRAQSMRTVTIEDIIEVHGPRALATEAERSLRAAFVLVTAEEPTAEQIELADGWAAMFGCHGADRWLLCFEEATQGLATMRIDLPETRQ